MKRRIETTTSRTAEMTCMSRAFSALETNCYYKSDDRIAPLLLPDFFQVMARIPFARRTFIGKVAPKGIYEYVIARTRYIDAAFEQTLADQVDQVLIFGAGFDTRALRFQDRAQRTHIFELDAPVTQQAKIRQYHKRGLTVPANCTFIAIDFDKETLRKNSLRQVFAKDKRIYSSLKVF
jgi:methyltransferase (TIGR00027 family)